MQNYPESHQKIHFFWLQNAFLSVYYIFRDVLYLVKYLILLPDVKEEEPNLWQT